MEEIYRACNAVTVLRDGAHVDTRQLAGTTEDDLVRMMVGRSVERFVPAHAGRPPGEELPEVLDLSTRILVLRGGRVVGELYRARATGERVLEMMAGIGGGGRAPAGAGSGKR